MTPRRCSVHSMTPRSLERAGVESRRAQSGIVRRLQLPPSLFLPDSSWQPPADEAG